MTSSNGMTHDKITLHVRIYKGFLVDLAVCDMLGLCKHSNLTRRRSESAYIRQVGFGRAIGWEREMGCMREMADALWEGHTLLKTGLSAHRHTHADRQTDRQVKTVYPPVSLRSLGGYNYVCLSVLL